MVPHSYPIQLVLFAVLQCICMEGSDCICVPASIAMYLWVALGAGDCGGPQLPGERRINPDYHLTTCVNQNLCPAFFASRKYWQIWRKK